jgi:hypothetical protein
VAEATLAMMVELLTALLSPPEMLPSDLQVGLSSYNQNLCYAMLNVNITIINIVSCRAA